jgi:ATP-dependent protease ClpP protease subunit
MSHGKNTEIEEVTKENRRLQKMYDDLIIERTNLKQSKLNTVKKNKKDWFFGVDEALENGLVHEII